VHQKTVEPKKNVPKLRNVDKPTDTPGVQSTIKKSDSWAIDSMGLQDGGKSTLLNIIGSLTIPRLGRSIFLDQEVAKFISLTPTILYLKKR